MVFFGSKTEGTKCPMSSDPDRSIGEYRGTVWVYRRVFLNPLADSTGSRSQVAEGKKSAERDEPE
jgi:hypothetical protein